MLLEESRDDIGPECERDTSVVLAPAGNILVGIRPEEIAEQTAVGDLFLSAKSLGPPSIPRELASKMKRELYLRLLGA